MKKNSKNVATFEDAWWSSQDRELERLRQFVREWCYDHHLVRNEASLNPEYTYGGAYVIEPMYGIDRAFVFGRPRWDGIRVTVVDESPEQPLSESLTIQRLASELWAFPFAIGTAFDKEVWYDADGRFKECIVAVKTVPTFV